MFLMPAGFRFGVAQTRIDQVIFGADPSLAVVSQNDGRTVPPIHYEILSGGERAERSRNVLAFNHDERVCGVNHVATKRSSEHAEGKVRA